MKVKDYTKIKEIHFNFPELMSDTAQKSILTLYNKMRDLKDKAVNLRQEATKIDKEIEFLEEQWSKILPLIEIEYEDIEVKDVINESYVHLNFDSEINKRIH